MTIESRCLARNELEWTGAGEGIDTCEDSVRRLGGGKCLELREYVGGVGESLGSGLRLGWWYCTIDIAIMVVHDVGLGVVWSVAMERDGGTDERGWDVCPTRASTGAS